MAGPFPTPRWCIVMVLAACNALLACGGAGADDEVELPVETDKGILRDGSTPTLADGPQRPDTLVGVLVVEGEEEPATFRLFRSPPGFEPAFSTYLPPDMTSGASLRDTVRIVYVRPAEGGGPLLEIFPLPAGLDRSAAEERVRGWLAGAADTVRRPDLLPGAVTTYLFTRAGESGRVDLVENTGRFVILRLRYPPEYGDGIEPRMEAIRDGWVWTAGSRPLAEGLAPLGPGQAGAGAGGREGSGGG